MINKIFKSLIVLLFVLIIPVCTFASGKLEVRLGEKVILNVKKVDPVVTYKWVITDKGEIINNQTGIVFNYIFNKQGEYNVSLVSVNTSGKVIKNTIVYVLAGDRYKRPSSVTDLSIIDEQFTAFCETLPIQQDGNKVNLIDSGRTLFNISSNKSNVIEYRIDKNIFEDTDGNGIANDDIDNSGDNTYLKGGTWQTVYEQGDNAKIVAEITLVNKIGEKAKKQIEILFADAPSRDISPFAKLQLMPNPDVNTNLVYLDGESAIVGFYSRVSDGDIVEYRIDKNIFEDTNGDGDPSNDIDNIDDISFKTGDVWKTIYQKTDDQIIAQLIIVTKDGKGSRIQRGITFSDKPFPDLGSDEAQDITLTADKTFVLKGAPIKFIIKGLTLTLDQYSFAWDFNNDGEVDKVIEADNEVEHIYDFAGVINPKVLITDKNDNSAERSMEILVKDLVSTMSDFEFTIENGNTAVFINNSVAAANLADRNLSYTWNFGDTDEEGYEKQKDQTELSDPVYTYNKAGTYLVSLTALDTDQVIDIRTVEIVIENDLILVDVNADVDKTVSSDDKKEGGSIIVTIIKIMLYLILIVLGLLTFIVGGYFAFLKVQHPDLTLEELIDEFKIKILALMGVHEMLETQNSKTEVQNSKTEVQNSKNQSSKPEEKKQASDNKTTDAPVPDWLKPASSEKSEDKPKKDIIEGEVEEEKPKDKNSKLEVQNSKLEVQNSKTETRNSKTEVQNSKTEVQNSKTEVQNSKTETRNSKGEDGDADDSARPVNEKGPVPDWLKGV